MLFQYGMNISEDVLSMQWVLKHIPEERLIQEIAQKNIVCLNIIGASIIKSHHRQFKIKNAQSYVQVNHKDIMAYTNIDLT